ncbi:MAG: hypothetical protein VX619_10025 [bacterium]|nr:hypothetical protein [bacterium]
MYLNHAETDPHQDLADQLYMVGKNSSNGLSEKIAQPAMTTVTEQAYCELYASQLFKGNGEMIELGCWLGSLTKSLAEGLLKNEFFKDKRQLIEVMDYFKWDVVMEDWVVGTRFENRVDIGGNFQFLYREAVSNILNMVNITQADLSKYQWSGKPIEFLLIDCMKRFEIADNVARTFFPSLIPNDSYVVHQDYLHFYHSWIHILMFRFRKWITPLLIVPRSSTVVFKCVGQITNEFISYPENFAQISTEEICAAFDWNFNFLNNTSHDAIAAAKVSAFIHKGEMETARGLYKNYISKYAHNSDHFDQMYNFYKQFDIIDLRE